jgi:hypothetical protein
LINGWVRRGGGGKGRRGVRKELKELRAEGAQGQRGGAGGGGAEGCALRMLVRVRADAVLDELTERLDELYPRGGVAGLTASWDEQYGVAVGGQLEEQFIVEAARGRAESDYISQGCGGRWRSAGGRSRPSPDFAKAREIPH